MVRQILSVWYSPATTAAFMLASIVPACVLAQQPAADTNSADAGHLEEIIVTAQKRAQNLQSVPVAVTAVKGEELTAKAITQFTDLPKISPSLTITENTNATSGTAIIRGIGTSAVSISIEPSVAVVVDDVALLQQSQAFSGLNDIARIEVLRGPQGTLFGKSSSAGVINIVTNAPTPEWSGRLLSAITTDDERRFEGSVSGPLGAGIGIRLNSFYDNRDGFVTNLNGGPKLGSDRNYGFQGKLVFDPAEALQLTLNASYVHENGNETPRTFLSIAPGQQVYGLTLPASQLAGITPGPGNYDTRQDVIPKTQSDAYLLSGHIRYSLGPVDLISITSYQDWTYNFVEDLDYTTLPVGGSPTGGVQYAPFDSHQVAEELRLVSSITGPFQYLVGAYFSDGRTGRGLDRFPVSLSHYTSDTGSRTLAAFGQATYDITDTVHIDTGLRYNNEKIDVNFQNLLPVPTLPPANNAACYANCSGDAQKGAVTGKVALRKDLTDSMHAYASFATGQKGQAYDISTGFTPTRAANPVKQETSHGYEIGLKSRLFDDRMQMNIAGFWADYSNFQAQSHVPQPDNTSILELANVGKLRTRGVEFETEAQPVRPLVLNLSWTYLDATILQYPYASCYTAQTVAEGCYLLNGAQVQNLAGKTLPNAPHFKFTTGGTYTVPMSNLPFEGFVQVDYTWQTHVNYDLAANPLAAQGAYGILNGSLGLRDRGDKPWQVTLFAHNLTNRHYADNISSPAAGATTGTQSQILTRDSTRYAGLRISKDF